jgi:Mb-OB3b family methanobactin precursor
LEEKDMKIRLAKKEVMHVIGRAGVMCATMCGAVAA